MWDGHHSRIWMAALRKNLCGKKTKHDDHHYTVTTVKT